MQLVRQHRWVIAAILCVLPTLPARAQDSDTRDNIAGLIRALGYGGAIHNFKNYVLRGDQKYGDAASKLFKEAASLAKALGDAELADDEAAAVESLQKTIAQYQGHVATVKKMHAAGDTVEAIDESVSVDDSSAIQALEMLREGREWNYVEELEFELGYGSGIHNFKDFVLRADESYRARAVLGLSKVLLIVARDADVVSDEEAKALAGIENVVRAYEEAVPKVDALIGEGKTAKEIDTAVKVDDGPAIKALVMLRKS